MATFEEVRDTLILLGAAYPNFQLQPATVTAYADLLSDLPAEVLGAAARQVATESRFFPAVAELRQAALGLAERADGVPTAGEAWREVERRVAWPGVYAVEDAAGVTIPLEFSHPLIRAAVDVIGWWEICRGDNPVATRAHFIKVFDELARREREDAALLPEVRAVIQQLADKMRLSPLTAGERRELVPSGNRRK